MATRFTVPGYRLVNLDTVDSTNDEARRIAVKSKGGEFVVRADVQTAGRGRHRRTWISEHGNLYFSMLLRPACSLAEAPQLGFVAVNAVADMVAAVLPRTAGVECKWPNDVLVGGRKVAGMLLESNARPNSAVDWLIVGIGINIASHPEDVRFPATSLSAEGAKEATPDAVFEEFLRRFRTARAVWEAGGFAPMRAAWLERGFGIGKPIRVNLESHVLEGMFEDIDETGALIIRRGDGAREKVTAGDVMFTPASEA